MQFHFCMSWLKCLFWWTSCPSFLVAFFLSLIMKIMFPTKKRRNVKGVHMHFSFIHLFLLVHRNIFSISIHMMLFKIQENIGNNTWFGWSLIHEVFFLLRGFHNNALKLKIRVFLIKIFLLTIKRLVNWYSFSGNFGLFYTYLL